MGIEESLPGWFVWTEADMDSLRPAVTARLDGGGLPRCPYDGTSLEVDPSSGMDRGREAYVRCPECQRSGVFRSC